MEDQHVLDVLCLVPGHCLPTTACGISTLDAKWNKAEEYLNSSNNVVQAPEDDLKSILITSHTSLYSSAVTWPVCL